MLKEEIQNLHQNQQKKPFQQQGGKPNQQFKPNQNHPLTSNIPFNQSNNQQYPHFLFNLISPMAVQHF